VKLADKFSALRIILAPVFFIVFFLSELPESIDPRWIVPVLWLLFIVAELTDMLDGMIARKRGEVSDFGKLFDPFADTLVQLTLLLCFVISGILPFFLYLIVLYREFSILFVRNLMLRKGVAMGARLGGKLKTVAYIAACALALAADSISRLGLDPRLARAFALSALIVFAAAVVLAVLSFLDYIKVYRQK
jgi:CDP-diacylglycerol--glycerol-3-phosphate 3-phosphatidyltransferase